MTARTNRKRYLVLVFLVGAAVVQAAVEWDKVRRFGAAAYEFIDAAVNNRIIYSEKRVESQLAPLRKEIADIKKKIGRPPVCMCGKTMSGKTNPPSGRTDPFSFFSGN